MAYTVYPLYKPYITICFRKTF